MAVSAFSQNGKYFSSIDDEGRLKIWDTETSVLKQEYTPDLHLSAPSTCLQWILLSNALKKKGKKRKSSGNETDDQNVEGQQTSVALGTGNGKILIYSINKAAVETVLTDDEKGDSIAKITCLDWNMNSGLYSCSNDNVVTRWDMGRAKVKDRYKLNADDKSEQAGKILAIKSLLQQNADKPLMLTATCKIRLWCLNSMTVLKTMIGHSSDISHLSVVAFTGQHKYYAVSAAKNERILSFWDITHSEVGTKKVTENGDLPIKSPKGKSKEQTMVTPVYNFLLTDTPKHMDHRTDETGTSSRIYLSATTKSGVLHFYGHTMNGVVAKPIKPSVTLQISTETSATLPLRSSYITHNGEATDTKDETDVLVSYEPTPGRLLFERVTLNMKNKMQVLTRENPSIEAQRKKKKSDAKKPTEAKVKQTVTYVEHGAPVTVAGLKRTAPGKAVDVPMESRLANLALEFRPGADKKAVSENFTKLLMQGLHSEDNFFVSSVLLKANEAIANTTVGKLPAVYIPKLIENLTQIAGNKTTQCKSAAIWLNAVLKHHSSLIMATTNTKTGDKISALLAVLAQRRSHLGQLLNLRGKLDLMINQINTKDTIVEDRVEEPVLDYIDASDGEDVSIDLENGASSDDSSDAELWDEDNVSDGSKESDNSIADSQSDHEQSKNVDKMETDSDDN